MSSKVFTDEISRREAMKRAMRGGAYAAPVIVSAFVPGAVSAASPVTTTQTTTLLPTTTQTTTLLPTTTQTTTLLPTTTQTTTLLATTTQTTTLLPTTTQTTTLLP